MASNALYEMHHDHRVWRGDVAFWRDQIDRWRRDYRAAQDELATVGAALRQHVEALDRHAEAIDAHQEAVNEHEGRLAAAECCDDPAHLIIGSHSEQTESHAVCSAAHERIRKHHQRVMVEIAALAGADGGER